MFQPLDGLESDVIQIAPVMCYDRNTHAGWFTAVELITARNIPPTNAPEPVDDINLASAYRLRLHYTEDGSSNAVITLDSTALQKPVYASATEQQVVRATLECLRRVAGERIHSLRIEGRLKPSGQEELREIVEAFRTHPKDQPFPFQ